MNFSGCEVKAFREFWAVEHRGLSCAVKSLLLVRHAKSSWDQPGLSDFDRPLNDRGKRDAPAMGKRLKERGIQPALILSSPAKRAVSTSKRLADAMGHDRTKIKADPTLYHADEEDILTVVRGLERKLTSVMIVGHNPGLTDFVNSLNRNQEPVILNIPTCGIVAFSFPIDEWKTIALGTGKFDFFDFPKRYPAK